jgi:hypothetical protein
MKKALEEDEEEPRQIRLVYNRIKFVISKICELLALIFCFFDHQWILFPDKTNFREASLAVIYCKRCGHVRRIEIDHKDFIIIDDD